MPQVLMTDRPWPDADIERAVLSEHGIDLVEAPADDAETLAGLAPEFDAIATCWANVKGPVIEAAVRCQHIARMGIGLDNIDCGLAASKGIPVTNVPDYCIDEVADHAFGLLLGLARNVCRFDRDTAAGTYDVNAGAPMRRLSTTTLGLVGFGRTAQAMAPRARGFGIEVKAWSPSGNDRGVPGVTMTTLEDVLTGCDFVSVHVPLNDETRHLIDADVLGRMKNSSLLINCSRGPVIDQNAVLAAVESGTIGGAGIDVYDPEPPRPDDPLLSHDRVITTPHAAFVSVEALEELRRRVAQQIVDRLQGRTPEHVVNGVGC